MCVWRAGAIPVHVVKIGGAGLYPDIDDDCCLYRFASEFQLPKKSGRQAGASSEGNLLARDHDDFQAEKERGGGG